MTPLEIESKRFTENVGKCWHEWTETRHVDGNMYHSMSETCKHCGVKEYEISRGRFKRDIPKIMHTVTNPTYTIELIRAELERVGKWHNFRQHRYELFLKSNNFEGEMVTLTSPLLFMQAANAYMEV